MASNTRSGRRPVVLNTSNQLDLPSLSNIERLLLAQAVHEVGANAWSNVSKILSKHPLLSRPKLFFNPHVGPFLFTKVTCSPNACRHVIQFMISL